MDENGRSRSESQTRLLDQQHPNGVQVTSPSHGHGIDTPAPAPATIGYKLFKSFLVSNVFTFMVSLSRRRVSHYV